MAKSVGTLYVDILARVDNLEKDLSRARKMIGDTDESMRKAGSGAKAAYESFSLFNSFKGRGMAGIVSDMTALTMAFAAVKREVSFVYENIDKIPGIPPRAVASVNEFKVNFHELMQTVHSWTAQAMASVFDFGTSVGNIVPMWAEVFDGLDAAVSSNGGDLIGTILGRLDNFKVPQATLQDLDKLRVAQDPAYWDKVREATLKLSESRKADAVAALTQAGRITELRKQAEEYETFARSKSIDTLQRIEAETKAYNKRKEANAHEIELRNKFVTTRQRESLEWQRTQMSEMTQLERLAHLRYLIAEQYKKMPQARHAGSNLANGLTPEDIEKLNIEMPQLIEWQKTLRDELARIKTPAQEMRDSFLGAFSQIDGALTSLVTNGSTKLSDFAKTITDTIIQTFLRLAVINPLINGIFGGGAGGALLPSFFGPGATKGKADGGNGSGWTLVGERGPELANLGSGSFVLPADETRRKLSGGKGNSYFIDARGADQGAVARLESALLLLAGPGVVERRALSASMDARWRRRV